VLLTKMDLLKRGDPIPQINAPGAAGFLPVSSASGQGVEELMEYLWKFVEQAKQVEGNSAESEVSWSEENH
jgi:50S ribosomal subunit-associated GTPase HflX